MKHPSGVLEVGKLYSPDRTCWEERIDYNFRCGTHELRIFMSNLSQSDVEAFRRSKVHFALYEDADLLMLLFRINGFLDWSDASYSWWMVPEVDRTVPKPSGFGDPHAILLMLLIEANSGLLKAMRACTFSPKFTTVLELAIRKQIERGWPGDDEYNRQLNAYFKMFPRAEMAADRAKVRCQGGD